jgi:hypothetical protein
MATGVLSKEALLGATPQTTTVEFKSGPLAGSSVVIRSLSRGARKAWSEAISANDNDATEILILESLVEPKLEPKDIKALSQVDEKVVEELLSAIASFNGWIGDQDAPRRETLQRVADGDLTPEEALKSFR